MAKDKKAFMLYADQIELFSELPDELAGKLIKHIFDYVNDKNPTTNDLLLKVAFSPIKIQLKRDLKKYENICEQNKSNISKRWNKKDTSVYERIRSDTEHTDKDKDKDKDIKKENYTKKNNFKKREIEFKEKIFTFKYDPKILNSFFEYWSEPNKSQTRMKFETEKTWDLNRRLKRWVNNDFKSTNFNDKEPVFISKITEHG